MTPAIYKQKSCRITDRKSTGHCDRYRECGAQSSAKDREYLIGTHNALLLLEVGANSLYAWQPGIPAPRLERRKSRRVFAEHCK